jgi:hypothetical protein
MSDVATLLGDEPAPDAEQPAPEAPPQPAPSRNNSSLIDPEGPVHEDQGVTPDQGSTVAMLDDGTVQRVLVEKDGPDIKNIQRWNMNAGDFEPVPQDEMMDYMRGVQRYEELRQKDPRKAELVASTAGQQGAQKDTVSPNDPHETKAMIQGDEEVSTKSDTPKSEQSPTEKKNDTGLLTGGEDIPDTAKKGDVGEIG